MHKYFVKKGLFGLYQVIGMFGVCGTFENKTDAAKYRNQLNRKIG